MFSGFREDHPSLLSNRPGCPTRLPPPPPPSSHPHTALSERGASGSAAVNTPQQKSILKSSRGSLPPYRCLFLCSAWINSNLISRPVCSESRLMTPPPLPEVEDHPAGRKTVSHGAKDRESSPAPPQSSVGKTKDQPRATSRGLGEQRRRGIKCGVSISKTWQCCAQ